MANLPRMAETLPEQAQASHRRVTRPSVAPARQTSLIFDREAALRSDEQELTATFREAVQAFGGADALRAVLGEKETYLTRILDGMAGTRPVQARWLLPLLSEPASAMALLLYMSERAGFEPPVLHRQVTDEEIGRAACEVLAESGQLRDIIRAQIAKRLGVRVEDVRL
jgi:hypothetical protein